MSGLEIALIVIVYIFGGSVTVGVVHRVEADENGGRYEDPDADAAVFILWPLVAVAGSLYLTGAKLYSLGRGGDS